jgi:hypothetical protein
MLFDSKEEEVQRAKIILLIAIWLKRFRRSAWQVFLDNLFKWTYRSAERRSDPVSALKATPD